MVNKLSVKCKIDVDINNRRYYLQSPYDGVYLTRREAECMHYTRAGMTMVEVSIKLGLSPRTVEYYMANVKRKLHVHSKEEVLYALKRAGFRF